jgi:tetratricopeptide (TPR) repeat protein
MLFKLIISILVCITSISASAQWTIMRSDADILVKKGAQQIYNLQFDSASANFSKVREMYPDHPAGYFLDAMVEWWRITTTSSRSKKLDDVFLDKINKTIEVCDKLIDKNRFDVPALFFKGGAVGYRGRFYATREQYLKAADDGRIGFDLLMECQKLAPQNHDVMLGAGLYNYFAATLPEQYPILKAAMMFLPSGDKKLGILQLVTAGKRAQYAATEAKVVLLQVYYQFEKNPTEAIKIAQELFTSYPDNAYFQRYVGRCQVQLGFNAEYESTWRDALRKCIDKKNGSYDLLTAREGLYYIGVALLNRNQLDSALRYFYKCDEAGRHLDEDVSGFTVKVNIKIGNVYDLQGKRELAISQYKKVLSWDERQNSHTEANAYIEKPFGK